ncbi:MAG: HslU--HslV peptidase ATPase subunit, partial [Candidatus Krumholzibacteriota bacterium]|nr:HslU--HslV peptidase ATPase subunit [Candidatus Krumholzibacteriota bacterium]
QGRFPIRVELKALTAADFERILLEPENALIKQYTAMIETEGCAIRFTSGAIKEIAHMAYRVNQKMENIGARRLHTILTTLLDDILFDLPDKKKSRLTINEKSVKQRLDKIVQDDDLAKYIL